MALAPWVGALLITRRESVVQNQNKQKASVLHSMLLVSGVAESNYVISSSESKIPIQLGASYVVCICVVAKGFACLFMVLGLGNYPLS